MGSPPKHVFCSGMYRACSTWQYEVVGHLLDRHAGAPATRLGYADGPDYAGWARQNPHRAAGWAVLKSHDKHPAFARALAAGKALAVYAFRDLRDVVDSMAHKMGLPFEQLMRQGLVHRVLQNDRFWTSRPGVVVQRYEDIVEDPGRAVAELAAHLGLALAPGEADQVAAEFSLEANRRRTDAMRADLQARGLDLSDPAHHQRYDPATLLHWNHLRQGRAGGWRSGLTPDQLALIDRLGGRRWLADRGYEPSAGTESIPAPAGLAARSRLSALIYFTARLHPGPASALRTALGMAPLNAAPAPTPAQAPAGRGATV
jgi:hypothetical protein